MKAYFQLSISSSPLLLLNSLNHLQEPQPKEVKLNLLLEDSTDMSNYNVLEEVEKHLEIDRPTFYNSITSMEEMLCKVEEVNEKNQSGDDMSNYNFLEEVVKHRPSF